MDFKVDVSLWNLPMTGNTPVPQQTGGASSFSEKLGLPSHQRDQWQGGDGQPQRQTEPRSGGAQPHSDTLWETSAQSMTRPAQSSAEMPGMLELYPLGLQAGRHLSHIPSGYLQSIEEMQPSPATEKPVDGRMSIAQRAAITSMPSPPIADGITSASSPAPMAITFDAMEPGAPPIELLAAHMARKWPERRCLVLPRGNGVELLIRDYHLTPGEQESLAADLSQRLRSSSRANQLWINGQCVWRRETLSSPQGDE